jgi:REP element-mobilizing transposase RayT
MARLARIAVVNVPQHVTQRGNARQFILTSDAERLVYLELLQLYVQL